MGVSCGLLLVVFLLAVQINSNQGYKNGLVPLDLHSADLIERAINATRAIIQRLKTEVPVRITHVSSKRRSMIQVHFILFLSAISKTN